VTLLQLLCAVPAGRDALLSEQAAGNAAATNATAVATGTAGTAAGCAEARTPPQLPHLLTRAARLLEVRHACSIETLPNLALSNLRFN
jgi:hypothetical protein